MSDVTQILSAIEQGDPHAAAELLPLVYDELRGLAAAHLADEKPRQTLQPTAVVHEAYVRLVGTERARIAGAGLVNLSRPCWAATQVGLTTSWATGCQPHLQRQKRLKQGRWRRTSRMS